MKHLSQGRFKRLSLIALYLFSAVPSYAFPYTAIPGETHWVDSVMNTLSRRERIAQLFMPVVSSTDAWSDKIHDYVAGQGVGGLFFDRGTACQQAFATQRAMEAAKVPLLLGADAEWGLAMRLTDVTPFPHNTTLGAIRDTTLLVECGRQMARQMHPMGIHLSFAPVADVNNNPANPVINTRSFGADPRRVATCASCLVKGLQEGGVMAVMKHFPGHGNTREDSHEQLAVVHGNREALDSVELLPFRRLSAEGIGGAMVGHLSVPAYETNPALPASQSKAVVQGLLRQQIGFEGLIITDALVMKGAAGTYSGLNCIRSLQAGNDILLSPANVTGDIRAVEQAVEKGILSDSLIDARCRRVLAYKYRCGVTQTAVPDGNAMPEALEDPSLIAFIQRLHESSMTLLRNEADFLPLRHLDTERTAVVLLGAKQDAPFARMLCRYSEDLKVLAPSVDNPAASVEFVQTLSAYDRVLVGVYANTSNTRAWVKALSAHPRAAFCFFTSPYTLSQFGDVLVKASGVLLAYETTDLAQKSAAQALMGGNPVDGCLPVPIGSYYPIGHGLSTVKTRLSYGLPEASGMRSDKLALVDSLVEDALQKGAFPGCQVLVAKDGRVVWSRSYGYTDIDRYTPVSDDHVYDLASVTKAIVTTPLIMALCEQGKILLDDPVSKHLPALRGSDKENLSYRQMLYHESRLKSYVPFYQALIDTASYPSEKFLTYRPDSVHTLRFDDGAWAPAQFAFYSNLVSSRENPPFCLKVAEHLYVHESFRDSVTRIICDSEKLARTRYTYSDLGFILMGFAGETLTGKTLDVWAKEELFGPLGAYTCGYRPLDRLPLDRIVPTSLDTALRHQLVHGYPHDEAAAFLGGVSGNAGMFSSANDLAKYLQMLLDEGTYGGHRYFEPQTVRFFTTHRSRLSRRLLGFDAYEPNPAKVQPVAPSCSPATYGHTGFTGTCFWVDPTYQLIYIFLSNRVHPDRTNNLLGRLDVRPSLQEAVYRSFLEK